MTKRAMLTRLDSIEPEPVHCGDWTAITGTTEHPDVIEHVSGYWIATERCSTLAQLGDWVLHLNQKKWVDPQTLADFVKAARPFVKRTPV